MVRTVYAVIETSVVVSAPLKPESIPGKVLAHALTGTLVPVMSAGIEDEYAGVLSRKKFGFDAGLAARVLSASHVSMTYDHSTISPAVFASGAECQETDERRERVYGFDSVHKITVEVVGMMGGSDSFETSELQMAAGLNIVHELPCEADTTLLCDKSKRKKTCILT